MNREEKAETVVAMKAILAESSVVVVVRNHGLTVAQSTALREQMRAAGAQIKVVKNRLAKLALDGSPYAMVTEFLTGPTALATSSDVVTAAKIAVEFAKKNEKLEIVGGAMVDLPLDAAAVKALATLPSLDVLRGMLIGLVQAPATKLAQITSAPASQLARVLNAYATKEAEAV